MRLVLPSSLNSIRFGAIITIEHMLKALKSDNIISVAYDFQRPNFGDILNKYLFSYLLSSYNVTTYQNADLIACGSLINYMSKKRVDHISFFGKKKPVKIWGSGFIEKVSPAYFLPRRPLEVYASRGQKTLEILKNSQKTKILSYTVGDPGLLLPILLGINNNVPRSFKVGIIMHYSHKYLAQCCELPPNIVLIDPQKDPLSVIQIISECTHIISTSLHGLVIADALGKKTTFAKSYPPLIGCTFKFEDYYSSYGYDCIPFPNIILDNINRHTIMNCIENSIQIDRKCIKKNMIDLLDSFPFPIESKVKSFLLSRIENYA